MDWLKKVLFTLAVLSLALSAGQVRAEREVVDKIIAVVGDEVILASELANQFQIMVLQNKIELKTEAQALELQQNILDEMVSDRLFLIAARKDTLVTVRDEEIESSLDDQVLQIAQNYPSYDDFTAALAQEGLTVRELKKKYYNDVKNQLLKQKFIQSKLYSVSVSKQEVVEFYDKYRDSIPAQPEAIRLAHILLFVKPSPEREDSVKQFAAELRQRILDGADFATISSQYSTSGAGVNGGELGYLAREDVVPEFARAAFSLNVGDISGVVRTEFGYHIIKCEGQKGDRLKLRHLLLSVEPSAADTQRTFALVDSLKNEIANGADFAQIAKAFSEDNETRPQGGDIGWFAIERLPTEFADAVKGWKTVGEVKGPVVSKFGVHILKLLDYTAEHKFDIENDYDRIKEMARQDKTGRMIDQWIEDIKAKTYISYNIEF